MGRIITLSVASEEKSFICIVILLTKELYLKLILILLVFLVKR